MITKFVEQFLNARPEMEAALRQHHPESYADLVRRVITLLSTDDAYDAPDPKRITVIDHGDYQGTQLYIIGVQGYQPSTYWSIFVSYGSCSGCDTFEALKNYDSEPPTEKQVNGYWTLMLHMVQNMEPLKGSESC